MVEITYHKDGDYFIPDLFLEKEEYAKDYNAAMTSCYNKRSFAVYLILFYARAYRKALLKAP